MKGERILIIGGAGFIGSYLTHLLTTLGHQVSIFDTFKLHNNPLDDILPIVAPLRRRLLSGCHGAFRGDALQVNDLHQAFLEVCPTRVIHLAALASAPLNDLLISDAVENAIISASNALQVSAYYKVYRFLLVSSSYVYGDFQQHPCDENHPCQPRSIYGASKFASELVARAIALRLKVGLTIVRLIAVYGPGDLNGKLSMQNLLRGMRDGILPIQGPLEAETDFTYVEDAVQGLASALLTDWAEGETFNIARGRGRQLAEVLEVMSSLGYVVRAADGGQNEFRPPKRGTLSISKAERLLGYHPAFDIEEGLAHCLRYLQEFTESKT